MENTAELNSSQASDSRSLFGRLFRRSGSIRTRLLTLFVLLVLLPTVLISGFSAVMNLRDGRQQVTSQLESVASLKEDEVDAWVDSLHTDLNIELTRSAARERLMTLLQAEQGAPEYQAAYDAQVERFNQTLALTENYEELFLMDNQGEVLLSTESVQVGKILSQYDFFREGLKGLYVQPPLYSISYGQTLVMVSRPVADEEGKTLGVLVGRANLARLSEIMMERSGLGETGETYLVGANQSMLTTSRFDTDVDYIRTDATRTAVEDQTNGSGLYEDYRGESVVGVYHWLPELQVALIAEQDQGEAFQGVYRSIAGNVAVALVSLGVAVAVGLVVTRRIADPIGSLTDTVTRFAKGDVEARAEIDAEDEIGVLASSFNQMAEQLGGLLDRVQARSEELEERSRELEASQRVTFAASEHVSPDELLDLVVNLIRDQFGLYHAQVYIVDEERESAVLRQSTGYAGRQLLQRDHQIGLDETALVTRAIREGEPQLVDDTATDPNFMPNPLLPETRSELVVPLKVEDEVIGVLDVQDDEPGRFNEETITLFRTMTDQVAFLFENSELLERVTDQTESLSVLTTQLQTAADIAAQLGAVLDPERLLQHLVELMQSRFGLYHAHIYVIDEESEQLVVRAGSGEVGQILRQQEHAIPLSAEKSLVARAARTRESILVEDTRTEPGFMPNPLLPQTRSEMSVPLVFGDEIVGVLDVQDDQPGRFSEVEQNTFGTLATQVAVALQNAELFERQQRAEVAMRQERNFSDTVINSLPGIFYMYNQQGELVRWNENFPEVLGYSENELTQMPVTAFIGEAERELVAERLQQVFVEGESTVEATLLTKEGKVIPYYYTGVRTEVDGEPYLVGVGIDIADRIEIEDALRESRAQAQSLLDAIPDMMFEMDTDGHFLSFKAEQEADLVMPPEAFLGKKITEVLPPQVSRAALENLERALSSESLVSYEYQLAGQEGAGPRDYEVRMVPSGSDRVVAIIRDVTERNRAEEQIRESEQRLSAALQLADMAHWEFNVPTQTFTFNDHYYETFANATAEEVGGYEVTAEEFAQRFVPPVDAGLVGKNIQQAIEADDPDFQLQMESRNLTLDGEERWTSVWFRVEKDEEGRTVKLHGVNQDITERKRTEERIRESQQRLSLLVEQSPLAVIEWNTDFEVEAWNPAAEAIFGYTEEEAMGHHAAGLVVPEEVRPVVNEVWQGLLSQTGGTRSTNENFTKEGRKIMCEWYNAPMVDADGNVLGVASLVSDITDRIEAERALRLTRASVENAENAFFWFDADANFIDVSDRTCEILGYSQEELLDMRVFEVDPEFPEEAWAELREQVKEAGSVTMESTHCTKSGREFPVQVTVSYLDFAGEEIYFSIAEDITDRVEAEEERQRFTNQLRTAADLTEEISAILDPDRLLHRVVDELQSRFDLYHVHVYLKDESRNDLVMQAGSGEVGRKMLDAGHSIPVDETESLVARAARSRKIVSVSDTTQETGFLPNPLLPETRSEVAIPLIAGGEVLGVFDVQDSEAARFTESDLDVFSTIAGQTAIALQNADFIEELNATAERLREVDRLKSEFLASMSHELRTPLNSIIGYTEIMLMGIDQELGDETLEDVQAIYDNSQQLLNIINDVLDLARIEAGRLEMEMEEVEVADIVASAQKSAEGLLVDDVVEFIVDTDEGLPAIWGDRRRIDQILNNLISNAIKFTEKGHVALRAYAEDHVVCIAVEDTGVGIAEEDQDRIFERFEQLNQTVTKQMRGTGLGLAITRELAELHGGTLELASELGEGSTFTVRLPVSDKEDK